MKEIRSAVDSLRKLLISKEKMRLIKIENFEISYRILTPHPEGGEGEEGEGSI